MTHETNSNQYSDLVKINNAGQRTPIIIYAHQLNRYYHTLLGNPFRRIKFYDSYTQQYQFYRTPGILDYIIKYYLHHGCLSTEVNYPPEILYDELMFFGFNIQLIYGIISNCITIDYYIPSNKYRRALWVMFNSDLVNYKVYLIRIATKLIIVGSVFTSFTFIELMNITYLNDYEKNLLIKNTLLIEIFILIFFFLESCINYFIRPRLQDTTTLFLILIRLISLTPISLLLFIWPICPAWLYNLLVIQYAVRIIHSVRLSSAAYEIVHDLTQQLSIYLKTFQAAALIILFYALLMLAFEKISDPVQFLPVKNSSKSLSEYTWISFNAFSSLGEGSTRPRTSAGLVIEFFSCLTGFLVIPKLVQKYYHIASNTIDKQWLNREKQQQNHFVMIEDEYQRKAIGQVSIDDRGYSSLPEILIQNDEF